MKQRILLHIAFWSPLLFIIFFVLISEFTPGYNHMSHTISRLSIMQNGWLANLNLIQFAFGIAGIGVNAARIIKNKFHKPVVRAIFFVTAAAVILAAITKTDPIENTKFSFFILSPSGLAHFSVLFVFLLFSPWATHTLYRIFSADPWMRPIAKYTKITGYGALIASIVWFLLFIFGIFLSARGMFEKIIALWCIAWMMTVSIHTLRHRP